VICAERSLEESHRVMPPCLRPRSASGSYGLIVPGLLLILSTTVFAAAPTLTSLNPAGGQRGTKVTVTCTGSFTWPVSVFAPGVDVTVGSDSGKLEVTIPADLLADRVWIRLYNPEGASNLLPFLIGNRPEVTEVEPNNERKEAQVIAQGSVVNGILQSGGDVDGYAVDLLAGETLVAALDANTRLGSPMDAMMQIVTPNGTILAENNDQIGLDPRIAYTARQGGRHIVRIFAFPSDPNASIAFAGAPTYIYRLTLTTGPYVTHGAPLSVPVADPGTVEVLGWNVPPNTILPVRPYGQDRLADSMEYEVQNDVRTSSEDRFGLAVLPDFPDTLRVRLTPFPSLRGIVPGEESAPQVLAPPTALTGCLRLPRQTDHFQIPLKKDQRLLIAAETRSVDSLLDAPIVRLFDPAEKMVAEINQPAPAQVYHLAHAAAVDGTYRLTVHDRLGRGGDQNFYRLTARLDEPDFELSGTSDALVLAHDKPTEFVVNVVRRTSPSASVGPITIEAVDLPPGVTAPSVTSEPSGPTAEKVTLSFTNAGMPFSGRIRIVGKTTQPSEFSRSARTPATYGVCFDRFWLTALAKPQ